MEEDGEGFTPIWAQGRSERVRRRVESTVFSSRILVFLLLLSAIIFLLFVVQHSSGSVLRPSDVKNSWDSLNILLVFLAIVFGLLGKNKNELQKSNPPTPNWSGYEEARRSDPQRGAQQWAESSDRSSFGAGGGASGGLRRSFGSYPDLYQMSPRWVSAADQWRFVDDTLVDASRFYDSPQLYRRRSWKDIDRIQEELSIKEEQKVPAPPPPLPPPAAKTTFKDAGKDGDYEIDSYIPTRPSSPSPPPSSPSPPPPPPPPPLPQYRERNSSKIGRKSGGSSATKEFILNSLSHKRKRKIRSKSVGDLDAVIHTSQSPPPTPPPPPPSVFHNLFNSKKSKQKKNARPTPTQRIPTPPPPPAARPPPLRASRNPTVSRHNRAAPGEDEEKIVLIVEDKPKIGEASPLIPIPPPPPPPPFSTKPAWKFVVKGGYVRIDSFVSSRSESPEPEDSDVTPAASEAGGERTPFPPSPSFCPSPDVNTKAENFISKFRAGLKLEKMNSVKMQGLGPSNLGPTVGSN